MHCACEEALEVKVHVWEPRVLGISTKRRVLASGPCRVECARASAMACGSQEANGWSLTARLSRLRVLG